VSAGLAVCGVPPPAAGRTATVATAQSSELEMVKARIESRGILFRLRVITSDVRQREAQPRRVQGAPVS